MKADMGRLGGAWPALTLLVALGFSARALAQSQPDSMARDFCANRPGKGTPTCVLDVGRLQVEADLIDKIGRAHV